jgi:hypothetical protein
VRVTVQVTSCDVDDPWDSMESKYLEQTEQHRCTRPDVARMTSYNHAQGGDQVDLRRDLDPARYFI